MRSLGPKHKVTLKVLVTGSALCLFVLLVCSPARALDPSHRLTQYAHTAWRVQDGTFTDSPIAITQTVDGYIWIGTAAGLVRFDGARFVNWKPPAGQSLPTSAVNMLFASRDGTLWIGTTKGLCRAKGSDFFCFSPGSSGITGILEDESGTVWLDRYSIRDGAGPLCRVNGQELQCFGKADGIPVEYGTNLYRDSQGYLWMGSYMLCQWKPGEPLRTYFQKELSSRDDGVLAMTQAPDGSLLAALDGAGHGLGIQQYTNGKWTSYVAGNFNGALVWANALFVDRNQAVWIGTRNDGLYRIYEDVVEHYRSEDGLSANTVEAIYQDHEGNIWVATEEGVDIFKDLSVVTFSTREGLSPRWLNSILSARDGSVWVGSDEALDIIRNGKISSLKADHGLPGRSVCALLEDRKGRLWLGLADKLMIYDHGKFSQVKRSDGSPVGGTNTGRFYAIIEDAHQDVWATLVDSKGNKIFHFEDTKLVEEIPVVHDRDHILRWLAPDPKNGVWIGMGARLARYADGHMDSWSPMPENNNFSIRYLLADGEKSVWLATTNGLFRWSNGQTKALTTANGLPCNAINALLEDKQDAIWLAMECGLARVSKLELAEWWYEPARQVALRLYDAFDGARPANMAMQPKATQSQDGRLWFANGEVVQMIDPRVSTDNASLPPVHIERLVADRKEYEIQGELRLPALTRDLEIDYTALSFVAPQKVRFRYMLEGRDRDWQDIVDRRQVFYNDLHPGAYRFRVIACNNSGVWNVTGATLAFRILPAWYQTSWFLILCIVTAVSLTWAIYQLRVRQIARAISVRFDERLAERTRIARELHDTLLQTVQGSKLLADNALDEPDDVVHLRSTVKRLSGWLGQATQEGRAALNSLRTATTETSDLAAGLRRATEECLLNSSLNVEFSVTGGPRDMHPIVRDEVYRIGYEAIRNACEHSSASKLEVSLNYATDLTLRVKDNGTGIDAPVVTEGKEGHFGLRGMRERASQIESRFTLTSSPDSGTEITLVVPGGIIFRKASATRFERVKSYMRRKAETSD